MILHALYKITATTAQSYYAIYTVEELTEWSTSTNAYNKKMFNSFSIVVTQVLNVEK